MHTTMTHRITADGEELVRGSYRSINVIYNNLIGENFKNPPSWTDTTHDQYLDSMEHMLNVEIRGKQLTIERIK